MQVNGQHRTSLWETPEGNIHVVDQRALPHRWVEAELCNWQDAATAIREMWVRGAPLIGITAAYGMYLAARHGADIVAAEQALRGTRPTAVNLMWALDRMNAAIALHGPDPRVLLQKARTMAQEDVAQCKAIGKHGLEIMRARYQATGQPVQIMTHCNAGWLAAVDYGTAIAPVYLAQEAGIPVHVWVSETRPRNQGFSLTAWELQAAGIPSTLLVDNAAGILLATGKIDMVIVGSDRTTAHGDVANKVGTYLKALAAADNQIPFYVALPSSSIDFSLQYGTDIIIEERSAEEVHYLNGQSATGEATIRVTPEGAQAVNYGFDITPARLVTGLITERGIAAATADGIRRLYPDKWILP